MAYRIAPSSLSIAARVGGALPVPVARMRTDGGTSFTLRASRSGWHPDLERTVGWLMDLTPQELRLMKNESIVLLPLPRRPTSAEPASASMPDARRLGWQRESLENPSEPGVSFLAKVTQSGSGRITLHAADRAFITLTQRADADGVVEWECRVQAKAPELYADGLNLWMVRWLGWLGWLMKGDWRLPRDLAELGWRTSQWHLNCDFTHLEVRAEDAHRMLGWRRMTEYTEGETMRRRGSSLTSSEWAKNNPYFANTLYLGRMTSDCCLVVYRKSEEIRDAQRTSPDSSIYSEVWRHNKWDGKADVTRVELRLRKKALVYADPETRETVLDLRDPFALLSRDAARHVWQHAVGRRRMTCEDPSTDRMTRAWVDPAWIRVLNLGVDTPVRDLRQHPRCIRRLTREVRVAKVEHQAVAAAAKWAAQHGAELETVQQAGLVLAEMGKRIVDRGSISFAHTLPSEVDVRRLAVYAEQQAKFFAGETTEHFGPLQEATGHRLKRVEWSKVRALPEHQDLDVSTTSEEDDT